MAVIRAPQGPPPKRRVISASRIVGGLTPTGDLGLNASGGTAAGVGGDVAAFWYTTWLEAADGLATASGGFAAGGLAGAPLTASGGTATGIGGTAQANVLLQVSSGTATGIGGTVSANTFAASGGMATGIGGWAALPTASNQLYPSASLWPSDSLWPSSDTLAYGGMANAHGGTVTLVVSGLPTVSGATTIRIRERPPLRLYDTITTPSGKKARWAADERRPENVPSGRTLSSTMPGGFENYTLTLPRRPDLDYADLEEFSTVTVAGVGGQVAWEGRLERTPRASGSQESVTPTFVGMQAHLADNNSAQIVYIDRDLTHWYAWSNQRQINLGLLGFNISQFSPSTDVDATTGNPSISLVGQGALTNHPIAEQWYGKAGIKLSRLRASAAVWVDYASDPNVVLNGAMANDDVGTGTVSQSFPGSPPGIAGGLDFTPASTHSFAFLQHVYNTATAAGSSGTTYGYHLNGISVIGDHGLTLRGGSPDGFFASDVVGHAVSRFAPQIAIARAGVSTIQPSNYVIAQLAFLDPTTAAEIIKQATRFDLQDWAVWEGPCFYFAPRGFYGRTWRARVGPANLQENGPQVDRIWNGIVVTYTDTAGTARTVGPPGSGSTYETTDLLDTSDDNPANQAGIKRWTGITMGTSAYDPGTNRPGAAIKLGQRFLSEQRLLNTSGDAALTGHVSDDHGILWPVWAVRAGDSIIFTDAHDTTPRRIVRAEYADPTKTCSISLDSPPDNIQQTIERMSVDITTTGLQ